MTSTLLLKSTDDIYRCYHDRKIKIKNVTTDFIRKCMKSSKNDLTENLRSKLSTSKKYSKDLISSLHKIESSDQICLGKFLQIIGKFHQDVHEIDEISPMSEFALEAAQNIRRKCKKTDDTPSEHEKLSNLFIEQNIVRSKRIECLYEKYKCLSEIFDVGNNIFEDLDDVFLCTIENTFDVCERKYERSIKDDIDRISENMQHKKNVSNKITENKNMKLVTIDDTQEKDKAKEEKLNQLASIVDFDSKDTLDDLVKVVEHENSNVPDIFFNDSKLLIDLLRNDIEPHIINPNKIDDSIIKHDTDKKTEITSIYGGTINGVIDVIAKTGIIYQYCDRCVSYNRQMQPLVMLKTTKTVSNEKRITYENVCMSCFFDDDARNTLSAQNRYFAMVVFILKYYPRLYGLTYNIRIDIRDKYVVNVRETKDGEYEQIEKYQPDIVIYYENKAIHIELDEHHESYSAFRELVRTYVLKKILVEKGYEYHIYRFTFDTPVRDFMLNLCKIIENILCKNT